MTRFTRTTNRLPSRAPSGEPQLTIVAGPDAPQTVALPPAGLVVGSARSADLCLSDDAVSRRHCSIVPEPTGFRVTDLESRNGTLVEGMRIDRALVPVGASIVVGTTYLRLLPADTLERLEPSERTSFGDMAGSSAAMREVYALLERAAASDASVLVLGESGTGKELCARAIHDHSARSEGPFVVFDCGAATETLLASDLFGHVRGAFTGADQPREGAFARAHGGTLFLDEIGDLPRELQPKLLRMLEAGEVTPLGGRRAESYDVRVVAATHHDLHDEAQHDGFRSDLYYRLAVIEAWLPPLRDRKDDLPPLVQRFLGRSDPIEGPNLEVLRAHDWPGNVRELRNVIARAKALGPSGAPFTDLPVALRRPPAAHPVDEPATSDERMSIDEPFSEAKQRCIDRFERAYLEQLLAAEGTNLARAARRAGVQRKHLYRLLERHGLTRR